MKKDLDEVLEMIVNGEISIRKASEEYDYTRDVIRSALTKKYGDSEKLRQVLEDNKANSTTMEIPQDLLRDVFFRAMNKEITLEEARSILGIKDKETLRMKFLEYAENSEDESIRDLYKKYMETQDYSHINFRLEAIKMVRHGLSQTDIALELGISPRTVSREFEKFKNDDDPSFYRFIKLYSEAIMTKKIFTQYELQVQDLFLDEYEEKHYLEIYGPRKTKEEERIEMEEHLVAEEKRLKGEGLTQRQIAEKLETSISSLRRARLNVQKRKLLETTGKNLEDDDDGNR